MRVASNVNDAVRLFRHELLEFHEAGAI